MFWELAEEDQRKALDFEDVDQEDTAGPARILEELTALRTLLCGEGKNEESVEASNDALRSKTRIAQYSVVASVFLAEIRARKEVCKLFESLLSRRDKGTVQVVDHIAATPAILDELFRGYESSGAVISGTILRACIKHKSLAAHILRTNGFWSLFVHMKNTNFDVASDAVTTFKELLVNSETKKTTAEFLGENYERFCKEYSDLLRSNVPEAYFARRQLLKLLGELLLDRTNFNLMKRYIQSSEHLKLMMGLFKDQSEHIKFEAFNVFKVFVANPDKSPAVLDILLRNQGRLIQYLEEFQSDSQDEQFKEEKQLVIKEMQKIDGR